MSINLAIGQGEVLVTPLQMANAYAAFANGGTLYQPTVISKITAYGKPDEVRLAAEPKVLQQLDLDSDEFEAMNDGFEGVTQDRPSATAKAAFDGFPQDRWPVAGKTGTANFYDSRVRKYSGYTASFIGYAPADDPQIVVAVIIQKPAFPFFGGYVAGPVFKDVTTYALQELGIPPTGSTAAVNTSRGKVLRRVCAPPHLRSWHRSA